TAILYFYSQTTFVVDKITTVIKLLPTIKQRMSSTVESSLSQLTKLGKPFNDMYHTTKNGAGLQTASSCFWDNSTDGSCTVRWENKTIYTA
uniref:Uncharacterized protein n=1 Tax=Sinocyclocheilus anshuiensis TaxID=1608454 RepID=A0A671N251_9TELE